MDAKVVRCIIYDRFISSIILCYGGQKYMKTIGCLLLVVALMIGCSSKKNSAPV